MTGIRIEAWNGSENELAEIADLYAVTFAEPPYDEDIAESRATIAERITRSAATKPRFRLLVARDSSGLAGFVFGTGIGEGDWWHDRIAPVMTVQQRETWLDEECFSVAELAVAASRRRSGLARQLMTAVLTDLPCSTAVLGCYGDAIPARRLYAALGWEPIVTDTLSDGRTLHILGRRLTGAPRSSVEG